MTPEAATSRDDLLRRLAAVMAGDPALLLDGWTHLALVSVFEGGGPDASGFCYLGDGRSVPVSPSDFAIFDVLEELRAAMARADETGRSWAAALVRVERDGGRFDVEFEYDHPERLAITPANVADRARELAPG